MKKSKTGSFVLTLPLRMEPYHQDFLDKVFRAAGKLYNLLVADRKKAMFEMEKTKEWRSIQTELSTLYKTFECGKPTTQQKEELQKLYDRRKVVMTQYGFSEYQFYGRINKYRHHYKKLIGMHVAQNIAADVWRQFESYFFGDGKQVSFKPWTEFHSIRGSSNETNIRYRDGVVYLQKVGIPVVIRDDPYVQEALSRRVKYCCIVRRPWKGKHQWLYSLQLILEGGPPVKSDPETGEVLHSIGAGRVGIDIGTQTVAFASSKAVGLEELAPNANLPQAELRRINRAMDRSRRATNPDFFNPDGTVVSIDKLSASRLKTNGKRDWIESKRYKQLAAQRRYLYAKLARIRKHQHQELVNRLITCGDEFYIETMSFKGLAKKAKYQDPEPGKKHKRRKRFGKSIADKAPATMVTLLEKKVLANGGSFHKINTWQAKASQYNHLNHEYQKKKLSQRWAKLDGDIKIQRDLYSAFLIMNTNSTLDGFVQELCDSNFETFKPLHDAEILRLKSVHTPSSTGVRRCA